MDRRNNNGCLLRAIGFIIITQILSVIIPPIYHYIKINIVHGNDIILCVIFAIIDILILICLNMYKEDELCEEISEREKIFTRKQQKLEQEYNQKYRSLEHDVLQKYQHDYDQILEQEILRKNQEIKRKEERIKAKVKEIFDGNMLFQKVASMYADAQTIVWDNAADYLETKSHPAPSTAEEIRKEIKVELKKSIEQFRIMKYSYEFLLNQFPQLKYYVDDYCELGLQGRMEKSSK